jgi:hypothetical protein
MKKAFLLLAVVSLLGFNACEKENNEAPGTIPGLGNTPGEIEIKAPFKMPDGISIIGEITGLENAISKTGESKLANDSKSMVPKFGSGLVVRVRLTLLNSTNNPRTIFFPKGLVWKCLNDAYQHGLQLQITWVSLAPNEQRTIYVDLYCLNLGIPPPDQEGKYKILGVTSSTVLWDLLNKIGWRKINFEMIYGNITGKGDSGPTYEEITDRLQSIVHNLTDRGIGISSDDEVFINGIPEITPENRPEINQNAQYPEYYEEFMIAEQ